MRKWFANMAKNDLTVHRQRFVAPQSKTLTKIINFGIQSMFLPCELLLRSPNMHVTASF